MPSTKRMMFAVACVMAVLAIWTYLHRRDRTVSAGHVEVEVRDGVAVVQDSTHVLELAMTRSSRGGHFVAHTTAEFDRMGVVPMFDAETQRGLYISIERPGSRRPANIQRYFDAEIESSLRRQGGTKIANRGVMFGTHAGRILDVTYRHEGPEGFARVVWIDIEEHDLVVNLFTGFNHAQPTAEDQQWLDDVVADVADIKVTPPEAASR